MSSVLVFLFLLDIGLHICICVGFVSSSMHALFICADVFILFFLNYD